MTPFYLRSDPWADFTGFVPSGFFFHYFPHLPLGSVLSFTWISSLVPSCFTETQVKASNCFRSIAASSFAVDHGNTSAVFNMHGFPDSDRSVPLVICWISLNIDPPQKQDMKYRSRIPHSSPANSIFFFRQRYKNGSPLPPYDPYSGSALFTSGRSMRNPWNRKYPSHRHFHDTPGFHSAIPGFVQRFKKRS